MGQIAVSLIRNVTIYFIIFWFILYPSYQTKAVKIMSACGAMLQMPAQGLPVRWSSCLTHQATG